MFLCKPDPCDHEVYVHNVACDKTQSLTKEVKIFANKSFLLFY